VIFHPLRNTPCKTSRIMHHDIRRSGISATTVPTDGTIRPWHAPLPTDPLAVQTPHLCQKNVVFTASSKTPEFAIPDLKLYSAAISTPLHSDYRKPTGRDSCAIALPAHQKYTALSDQVHPARRRAVVIQTGLKCKTQGGGV
jgi:hypothetical protein